VPNLQLENGSDGPRSLTVTQNGNSITANLTVDADVNAPAVSVTSLYKYTTSVDIYISCEALMPITYPTCTDGTYFTCTNFMAAAPTVCPDTGTANFMVSSPNGYSASGSFRIQQTDMRGNIGYYDKSF
jgi:hypothetical protein